MRMQSAGKHVIVVLLNAKENTQRMLDAENVRRYLSGEPVFASRARPQRIAARKSRHAKGGVALIKAKVGVKTKIRKKGRTT
jgi:D-alanyl-D-alanine carboxypeptidase/D-alanyl-D-alanine endopeptidase (penicillin-binding protein 7)